MDNLRLRLNEIKFANSINAFLKEYEVTKLKQQINEDLDMKHIPDLMKIINKDVEEDAEFIPEDKKERKEFFKNWLPFMWQIKPNE